MPAHFDVERELIAQGFGLVAGIDEVGRGPLAGPVCVAAVILDPQNLPNGLDDSKKLSPKRRLALAEEIYGSALAISVVMAPAAEVDVLNIRGATLAAMVRAARTLALAPAFALIDGRDAPDLICPARSLVDGDAISMSIAAASIVAKVARDNLMQRLDRLYPVYGFAGHAGYGTAAHLAALKVHGPCPEHRRSFAPVRAVASLEARP
jgi:ribonuclease HII